MRNANWATDLTRYILSVKEKPFEYGTFDCALFAADCAKAVCSVDPAKEYRGKYATEIGAFKSLKKTHGSLEQAFDAFFKRTDAPQRGDICVHIDKDGKQAAAVRYSNGWLTTTDNGVAQVNIEPLIIWRVDRE